MINLAINNIDLTETKRFIQSENEYIIMSPQNQTT